MEQAALVTGAASGIGAATARVLGAAGAMVALADVADTNDEARAIGAGLAPRRPRRRRVV
ncbi:SDR family NAD(P)-dependent oxidoreductase [Sphingomonas sp. MMS24-JH45]